MFRRKFIKYAAPFIKLLTPYRLPRIISIEATNKCFINCITCPIPTQMQREKGNMSLSTFNSILEQLSWKVDKLSWAFGGEPLLNNDLWEMIGLASDRGIPSKVDTNGMLLDNHRDKVFSSKLKVLNIAFEGLSKESTGTFRAGYDYELVTNNIKLICEQKKKMGVKYPTIALNYLVRKDNEHEINDTIKLAREWGVNYITLKSINISPSFWLSESEVQAVGDRFLPEENDRFSRYYRKSGRWVPKESLSDFCRYLSNSVTISWDGNILPCCFDFDASMVAGNINDDNFKAIWKSRRFCEIRRKVYDKTVEICRNCTSVSLQETLYLNS